jgi:hypothetical protein
VNYEGNLEGNLNEKLLSKVLGKEFFYFRLIENDFFLKITPIRGT